MAEASDSATTAATDVAFDVAADRAAFLKEIADAAKPAEPEKPAAKAAAEPEELEDSEEDTDTQEAIEADAEDESDDDESDEDAEEEVEAKEDEAEEPADAETARRLKSVQKAELRSKERLERDKKAAHDELNARVAKIESEWRPRIEKAEAFERHASRVRSHTVDVLRALGMPEDDFEHAARQLYAHSKAAGLSPEHKAAAQAAAREREVAMTAETAVKRVSELEESLKKKEAEAAARATAAHYLGTVETAIGDKSPLAARAFKKNPAAVRQRLGVIAGELIGDDGKYATPAKVLAEYERRRRAELEDDGVDVAALLKTAAPAKADGKKASPKGIEVVDKTKKAAKPDEPKRPLTPAEEREEILKEIAALPRDD